MVKYVYDAWGNHKVLDANGEEITDPSHIGNLNPYRYRGYFFDKETGLYYLKSRYYDPVTGRFLNADTVEYLDPESIQGLNLYAYCGNNPVMNVDPTGHAWYHVLAAIGLVLVVAAATVLTLGTFGVAVGGAGLVGAVIHGAAVGALVGAAIGVVGGAVAGGIYSAITGADFWSSVAIGAMAGFGIGAVIGAVVGGTISGIGHSSIAQVDIRKFTDYALDPVNSKGKSEIFKNLGYTKSDARKLVKIYKKQGTAQFLSGKYTLGTLDKYGQRIAINITLKGTEIKTGWMLLENCIRLITPFAGFIK